MAGAASKQQLVERANQWVPHRSFADILAAVKVLVEGKELTWDQRGLITQVLPARMSDLAFKTDTTWQHAYLMLAEHVRTNTPLCCIDAMALEGLEECLTKAVDEAHGREDQEMGQAVTGMSRICLKWREI